MAGRTRKGDHLVIQIVVVMGLALVAAVLVLRERSGSTATLPGGDRIAYIGTDGNLRLLDTRGPLRQITKDGHAAAPLWSQDGRLLTYDDRIPFAGGFEVAVKTWDYPGGEGGTIGNPRAEEQSTNVSSKGDVASVADGGLSTGCGRPAQPYPPGAGVQSVAWSPDGSQLAVAIAKRPGLIPPALAGIPLDNGIYIIAGCDGNPRPLLPWPAMRPVIQQAFPAQSPLTTPVSNLMYGPSELAWSPDGRYLLFQPALLSASGTNDIGGVFSVPVAGGEPVFHGTMLHSWTLLSWFPSGHRFAFTLGEGRDMYWGKRIAVAEAGVPGAQVIAEDPDRVPGLDLNRTPRSARSDGWPAISADGSRIVFQASEARGNVNPRLDIGKIEGPKEGIWAVNADGSDPRQLTSDPYYLDFFPQWSADGQSIMFVRTDGKQFVNRGTPAPGAHAEIWIMRANGSDARPLRTDLLRIGSYYGLFAWNFDLAWYRAVK